MSKVSQLPERCGENNLLHEQCSNQCKSSEHSELARKAQRPFKLDMVDWLCGIAARKDAVKTFYPMNSVLTNISPLNILSSLGKLRELSS